MNSNVIITAAITGSGESAHKSPHVPVTPKELAHEAIEVAKAGAAIAHIHVRDPKTGLPARDLHLYREVVERIREQETDIVINLTTGMGGDLFLGPDSDPLNLDTKYTDLIGQYERQKHVEILRPEICTLDCGSFNYNVGNYVYVSTTDMLRKGAARLKEIGVKPELEVFDLGHIWFAKEMLKEGLLEGQPLFQLCMGIKWGAEGTTRNMLTMMENLPKEANWSAFGIGQMEMPIVAQTAAMGGNIRVGLEDNLYLKKGVLATNAQLVTQARTIVEAMGATIQTPEQARQKFGLKKQEAVVSVKQQKAG